MSSARLEMAFNTISALANDFHNHRNAYMAPTYQEAEVRKDFIDKFFKALGWDIDHNEQSNPYERDVKVEKTQKQQGARAQRFADYAFYLAPNYKDEQFFVEAKKPSVNLKNVDYYFQIIKYGWNAGCPISVLTDFEQFHIIDCRNKPDPRYVFNGQHKEYHYTDYLDREKFEEIYWVFSREAVQTGNIERYAGKMPKPKGNAIQKVLFKGSYLSIDESFLEYIDNIRENLAKAFKKAKHELNGEELTAATQKTVDRLVFIRFLEDKAIEPNDLVSHWGTRSGSVWKDFIMECRGLDAKYSGVVFKKHFIDGFDFVGADENLFADICADISSFNSPYNFNYIPIHILGSIYERFLGKIVVATDKRIHIDEKPEVRKAGGVYYTPVYIVNHIVNNTVAPLIEGKTPNELCEMRFADIACGSGSFLIGVYDFLLQYHYRYFNNKYKDRVEPLHKNNEDYGKTEPHDGLWTLTLKLKQDILLNNIYGVDLDSQAVEVTQLSLFLKMLEDETSSSAHNKQGAIVGKILPDLSKNIVCGNSLIESDIANGKSYSIEQMKRINAFEYEVAFPNIFPITYSDSSNGKLKTSFGFDAVIGNPPYGAELSKTDRAYLNDKYKAGNTDTAALFMLNAYRLIKDNGRVGFIIPKAFTYSSSWKKTRDLLLSDITTIIDCSKVWKEVKLEMSIYFSTKKAATNTYNSYTRINDCFFHVGEIEKKLCNEFDFIINGVSENEILIALKMKQSGVTLNDYFTNQRGAMLQNLISDTGSIKVLGGKQINRYSICDNSKGMIEKNSITDNKAYVDQDAILVQNIVAHVTNPHPRIIIIATIPQEIDGVVILDTINQLRNKSKLSSYALLAVINSKLISWYTYKFVFANAVRTMHFDSITTAKIPFPTFNFSDKAQKKAHDDLFSLAKELINLKKDASKNITDRDKALTATRIEILEWEIEKIVAKAFNLSESELFEIRSKPPLYAKNNKDFISQS